MDRAALVALYEVTGGPSWRANYKWLTTAPLGGWQGIDVDEEGRGVGQDRDDPTHRGLHARDRSVARPGIRPIPAGRSPGGRPAAVWQTPPHRARARRRLDWRRRSMGGPQVLGPGGSPHVGPFFCQPQGGDGRAS